MSAKVTDVTDVHTCSHPPAVVRRVDNHKHYKVGQALHWLLGEDGHPKKAGPKDQNNDRDNARTGSGGAGSGGAHL